MEDREESQVDVRNSHLKIQFATKQQDEEGGDAKATTIAAKEWATALLLPPNQIKLHSFNYQSIS
ncbi:hypothetical protein PV327_002853, partial [Microctonus hyperodae]